MVPAPDTYSKSFTYLDQLLDKEKIDDLTKKMDLIVSQWKQAINDYPSDSDNKSILSQSNEFVITDDSKLGYKNTNTLFNKTQLKDEYTIQETARYCYNIFRTGSIKDATNKIVISEKKKELEETKQVLLQNLDDYQGKLKQSKQKLINQLNDLKIDSSDKKELLKEIGIVDEEINGVENLKKSINNGCDDIYSLLKFKEENKQKYFRLHIIILASVITIITGKFFSRIPYILGGIFTACVTLAIVFRYRSFVNSQQEKQQDKIAIQRNDILAAKVHWKLDNLETETPR
jgi:hypothetical protein